MRGALLRHHRLDEGPGGCPPGQGGPQVPGSQVGDHGVAGGRPDALAEAVPQATGQDPAPGTGQVEEDRLLPELHHIGCGALLKETHSFDRGVLIRAVLPAAVPQPAHGQRDAQPLGEHVERGGSRR